ncbi:MAG: ATP synthase F0 subunit C [Bacteroidetes bacterium]|nr:ATP synthase F0 subunit C [Bacteroidota bacterium]
MEAEAAKYIAKGLIIVSMLGTAIGEGLVAAKAMEAIGRNPSVADSVFSKMIVGMAICESTAIYALVAFFII